MLKIEDLHVNYGGIQALRGISLEVPDAEKLAPLDKDNYHSEYVIDYVRIYQK